MKYPYPSETFAGRDVRAYKALGLEVDTYDLKTMGSPWRFTSDLVRALIGSPGLVAIVRLALSLFREAGWERRQRVKCLALLPFVAVTTQRLHRSKPDVVHLFWGHYPALVGELCQVALPSSKQSIFLGAYDLWLRLPISKRVANRVGHVFTHANENIADLRDFLGGDIEISVVHRGIELEYYPVEEVRGSVRRPQVVAVGRLVDVKGFDDVIEAFSDVAKVHLDAQLLIVGDGPDRDRLEEIVRRLDLDERVTFLGWIDENEVPALLLESRVSVLLSRKPGERLPNVLKEAMAAGCVVVTTPTPGVCELVAHGESGFIVGQGDRNAAARAILAGLDEAGSGKLIDHAIAVVHDRFDSRRAAERYVERWAIPTTTPIDEPPRPTTSAGLQGRQ